MSLGFPLPFLRWHKKTSRRKSIPHIPPPPPSTTSSKLPVVISTNTRQTKLTIPLIDTDCTTSIKRRWGMRRRSQSRMGSKLALPLPDSVTSMVTSVKWRELHWLIHLKHLKHCPHTVSTGFVYVLHMYAHRFHHWVGKISHWRAWQPTPVFFPWESPWTEEHGGIQSRGCKESDMTEWLSTHSTHVSIRICTCTTHVLIYVSNRYACYIYTCMSVT